MQNYQYYFGISEPVYSPVYYTRVSGYCFQLYVKWSGENKENLVLYFSLCHGKNSHKELKPFRVPHTLQIRNKKEKKSVKQQHSLT